MDRKFRNRQEFYIYLTVQIQVLLPEYQHCQFPFMQAILEGRKGYFLFHQAHSKNISQAWDDWSVKNAYPLVRNNSSICWYLPTEELDQHRYCDKLFFWKVSTSASPLFRKKETKSKA